LNQVAETLTEVQKNKFEATPRVNGMMSIQESIVEPDESQMAISNHPKEGMVEDVTVLRTQY
jgi:hypothetical protein